MGGITFFSLTSGTGSPPPLSVTRGGFDRRFRIGTTRCVLQTEKDGHRTSNPGRRSGVLAVPRRGLAERVGVPPEAHQHGVARVHLLGSPSRRSRLCSRMAPPPVPESSMLRIQLLQATYRSPADPCQRDGRSVRVNEAAPARACSASSGSWKGKRSVRGSSAVPAS